MSELLQTVIPVVLTALIAGQVAITRTGRLRKDIRETIDLLGKLPADHPSRATLEVNIGELVDTLVRRQRRRFEPITRAGGWFGVNITLALLMRPPWVGACLPGSGAIALLGDLQTPWPDPLDAIHGPAAPSRPITADEL